jgi:hypothetical protein
MNQMFGAGVTAAYVVAAVGLVAAQRSIMPPPPGSARVVVSIDKPTFFLGENVLIHYCLENTSVTPFQISYGGDSRGASRSLRTTLDGRRDKPPKDKRR